MLLKICGMKYNENIVEIIPFQPNFMGFIFHKKSPRNIEIVPSVIIPDSIEKVGVFVNASLNFILEKANQMKLSTIQLHGHESPQFCKELKKSFSIIKAFNIDSCFDFNTLTPYEPFVDYFLLDAKGKSAGGNGVPFDWELLKKYTSNIPFLLSGGINATMIKEIKTLHHPQLIGIDINSGVEKAPGLKDSLKIKQLTDELQRR